MSATSRMQVRPVARPLLRTFWTLHRAVYRLTGGRLGLQQPERGAKFGMLRLHTLGRRSGHSRVAIVGYFEDGPKRVQPDRIDMRADASEDAGQTWRQDLDYIFTHGSDRARAED